LYKNVEKFQEFSFFGTWGYCGPRCRPGQKPKL